MKSTVVKIAFDDVSVDGPFGQRTGAMGTGVVGDVNLTVYIEYSEDELSGFNFDSPANGHLGDAADQ